VTQAGVAHQQLPRHAHRVGHREEGVPGRRAGYAWAVGILYELNVIKPRVQTWCYFCALACVFWLREQDVFCSVSDPELGLDPDSIMSVDPYPDPGRQNNLQKFHVLKCWMFSFES
jgi:hypothetical protein